MWPWEQTLPPTLYKYLPPERVHILNDCRVRFSQRFVFKDDHELAPGYATFGSEADIWKYVLMTGAPLNAANLPKNVIVKMIAEDPKKQKIALEGLQKGITILDKLGIFCLSEVSDSDRMWAEYAGNAKGFVIGFDTGHAGMDLLKGRGKLGKVAYSDEPIGSALASFWNGEGVEALFRKRNQYLFEQEWRIIRLLERLERTSDEVFLTSFDPAIVTEIIFRADCAVESRLRDIAAGDDRYKHVKITSQ